ncbi:MAG: hypothetical protein EPN88_05220 [Bacteroidetes bacterium]|nr:MAG: hypothetical protein EPN88_05220 [Bacteroidota bacterium]
MRGYIIRKIFVVLIILIPVFSYSDCKKQAKCGCDGDVLYTLTNTQAKVYYNETGTNITFSTVDNPYATYNFCNPGEMFYKFKDYKSGDVLLVSGHVFWECNYLYQSSNYSYQTYYKVYMIQVTDVTVNLYGKK